MSNDQAPDSISLFFRDGGSDKQYDISLNGSHDRWVVDFANGRRGGTLRPGTKTQTPVPYEEARKIFDKLVREKTSKGYTPGAGGTPFSMTDKAGQVSGVSCQLLNAIEEDDIDALIESDDWIMQAKLDGERRFVLHNGGSDTRGINRKGLFIPLVEAVAKEAQKLNRTFLVDGEAIGETVTAFDLLELGGVDLRSLPYEHRFQKLWEVFRPGAGSALRVHMLSEDTTEGKRRLLAYLRAENAEGVVFKRKDAPYSPGRPNSGGSQLKFKFYETASVIVSKVNDKRSVAVSVIAGDEQERVMVGNVTIPPNLAVPSVGDVVEVRYLYAYEGGSLYQPVYLGGRPDIAPLECTIDQLKYRADEPAPASPSF